MDTVANINSYRQARCPRCEHAIAGETDALCVVCENSEASAAPQEQGWHTPSSMEAATYELGYPKGWLENTWKYGQSTVCRIYKRNGAQRCEIGKIDHPISGWRAVATLNAFHGLSTAQIEALGPGGVAKLREALAWYVSRETASPYWCDAMPTVGAELIGDARGAVEVAKLQAALEGLLPAYETMLAHLWADMPAADRASRQSALEAAQAAIGGGK